VRQSASFWKKKQKLSFIRWMVERAGASIINALSKNHYLAGTIGAQFRAEPHPSSENRRHRTAQTGNTPIKARPRHATGGRAPRRTRPTEATAPVSTRRPDTARTPAPARSRTGRNPATPGRSPHATPAGQPPPSDASPARSRCTIAQSTEISPSNAPMIRQSQTNRSQQPTASAAPKTPPTAPRSAFRLELGETATVSVIHHSTPHPVAELKSKIHHSRSLTHY
jgi:hypothetical protein